MPSRSARKHVGHGGTLSHAHDLGEQVVGERNPGGGGPGTQGSVDWVGDVTDLNRSRHSSDSTPELHASHASCRVLTALSLADPEMFRHPGDCKNR